MSRLAHLIGLFLAITIPLSAQDKFHIFPQVADGVFSDGAFFKTTFLILPWFERDAPTCSLRLYGLSATLGGGTTNDFAIPITAGGYFASATAANQGLRTGYATLTCSDYVFAQALYSFYAADGTKWSEATVFSSDESYNFRMIFDQRAGARLGIAIANNTDISHLYVLRLGTRTSTVRVPARSSVARFVDELIPGLPANTVGVLKIEADDFSEFAAIGLRFTGAAFTTIPAN